MRWAPLVAVAVIGAVVWWRQHHDAEADASAHAATRSDSQVERADSAPRFQCEGKTRCSEMRSCEEARFYLQSCPGVKMDGDHDGEPCEKGPC